jgi:outer membrane immunogenic protein
MKRILITVLGLMAVASAAARAADLPAKVYSKAPAAPPAVYDWSGFFVGFNAGGGSNKNCWTNSFAGGAPTVPSVSEGCIDTTGALRQLGYRWQASNWVFGVEAQGDWANLDGSTASLFLTAPQVTNQSKINALGLFTGQVGYAFNNVLWFVKGGAAVTSNRYNGIDTASGTVLDQARETRWGGTVGTGLEIGLRRIGPWVPSSTTCSWVQRRSISMRFRPAACRAPTVSRRMFLRASCA